jgi:hypothetical protein
MPAFAKSPRFIIGALVVLWLAYVIYANFQLEPITIYVLPGALELNFRVSAVIIGSAIFGSAATLVIQWLWSRRSSKKASSGV